VRYVTVDDDDALAAFRRMAKLEGIIPALEPAHAIAWLLGEGKTATAAGEGSGSAGSSASGSARPASGSTGSSASGSARPPVDLLTLSGRGDKDLDEVLERG
jgi:tryptophan synthase beta subunit